MNSTEENNELPAVNYAGDLGAIGVRLRAAREAKGMSQAEVAQDLRLTNTMIAALEGNHEQDLPPIAFVMGYIRSYARLVGITPQELEGFDLLALDRNDMANIRTSYKHQQKSQLKAPPHMALVAGGGLLLVAAAIAAWWLFVGEGGSDPVAVVTPEVTELMGEGPIEGPPLASSTPELEAAVVVAAVSELQAEPETFASDLDTVRSPQGGADEVLVAESSATAEVVLPTVAEEGASPSPPAESSSTPGPGSVAVASPSPLTDTMPQVELRFIFTGDSWTVVYDAAGRRLLYGTYKEGREIEARGEAPFKIRLGNVSGVELFYQGERFDHTPFNDKGVSRFVVGQASDNRLPQSSAQTLE